MASDIGHSNSVCPSGAAWDAMVAPIVLPAPGRLSTTTCWPHISLILAAKMRPVMSVGPPDAGPMIKRTDLTGKLCVAWAFSAAPTPGDVNADPNKIDRINFFPTWSTATTIAFGIVRGAITDRAATSAPADCRAEAWTGQAEWESQCP